MCSMVNVMIEQWSVVQWYYYRTSHTENQRESQCSMGIDKNRGRV